VSVVNLSCQVGVVCGAWIVVVSLCFVVVRLWLY